MYLKKLVGPSMQAKNDDAEGNAAAAKTKGNIALPLFITAVLFHIAAIIAIVTPIAVTISAGVSTYVYYCSHHHHHYYLLLLV